MRVVFALICVLLTFTAFPQEQRYVEEVAFYHLTNLQQIDESFKDVRYFMSGQLRNDTTSSLDVNLVKAGDTLFVKNPFPGAQLVEKKELQQFDVPSGYRGRKSHRPLQLKHFLKQDDAYYVHFSCMMNEYEGAVIVLVLDREGNLIKRKIVSFSR